MSEESNKNFSGMDYVLSVDNNDLIVYIKFENDDDIKYVCKNCMDPKSKRTKRLCNAIKSSANMSLKLISSVDNDKKLKLIVQNPLYDDDVYKLFKYNGESEERSEEGSEEESEEDSVSFDECQEESNNSSESTHSTSELNKNKHKQKNNKIPFCYIYVLELEQNKLYVGKSIKPLSRTGEHLISTIHDDIGLSGSAWTSMYKPIKILRIIASYDEFDEDLYTLRYMKERGIDNVRGGSFCELNLTNDNVSTISKMISSSDDKCYYCGETDHFINECPQRKVRRSHKTKRKKHPVLKQKDIPKSRIMKFYGASQLMKNSSVEIEDINADSKMDSVNENKSYQCHFCGKVLDSKQNLLYHERVTCKESTIVQKGKKLDDALNATLEANKKYFT